jgi:hypothetical protein
METNETTLNVEALAEITNHVINVADFLTFALKEAQKGADTDSIVSAVEEVVERFIRKYEGFYADYGQSGYKYRLTH